MSEKKIIDYWIKSSQEDIKTAESLFDSKRYHHCLFFCHLFLEKILKAVYIHKKHTAPPWIHDLLRLARESGFDIDQELKVDFREISRFNIVARYDDYKFAFYKRATREFTKKYFRKAKEIHQWLKRKL